MNEQAKQSQEAETCDAETFRSMVYFGNTPDYDTVERCEKPAVASAVISNRERYHACQQHRAELERQSLEK